MSTSIAHFIAVEVFGVVREALRIGMLATFRVGSVIAIAWIEVVIHMSVEVVWAVEPGSGSYKDSAAEPLRAVKAVGRALIRRFGIVAVRASGRHSDADRNLGRRSGRCDPQCSGQSG